MHIRRFALLTAAVLVWACGTAEPSHLSVADSDGKRTKAFDAMQARLMLMEDPGTNWRDWIVVFYVPDGSRDLTLLVENPEPREDQARFTATPLGI